MTTPRRYSPARRAEGTAGADTLEAFALGWAVRHAIERGIGQPPWERWQLDPVAYVRERLLEPVVIPEQAQILAALAAGIAGNCAPGKPPPRVAVRSGRKSGKTRCLIWAALWFYECFPNATVYMCAAIIDQTKNVLWAELLRVYREATKRGVDLDLAIARSPMGGVVSADGSRRILGISGREVESVAGISGQLLFIIDEASALPKDKAQAFSGNMLGGGAMLWASNPRRTSGPFYEAFFTEAKHWQLFHVDCERIAKWVDEHDLRQLLPHVINWDRILEAREMYGGVDDVFYRIEVLGNFVMNEQGRAIDLETIMAAHDRWEETPEDGTLTIGLDPAGPGKGGDDTAFALRRGKRIFRFARFTGISEDEIIAHLLGFMREYKRGEDEEPIVNVDAEGPIGGSLYGRLRGASQDAPPGARFHVFSVRASHPARRQPELYERTRDELFANLAKWLRDGGALPPDPKIDAELHDPIWIGQLGPKLKLSTKEQTRDRIGRSPDTADSAALCVWPAVRWQPGTIETHALPAPTDPQEAAFMFDQQAAGEPWWPEG